jgi:hypothetical protein
VGINYRQPVTGAVGQIKVRDVPSDIEAVAGRCREGKAVCKRPDLNKYGF